MATPNIGKGRLLRVCDECLLVDDHPRIFVAATEGNTFPQHSPGQVLALAKAVATLDDADAERLMTEFQDTSSLSLHYDCHRAGADELDPILTLTNGAAEGKRGAALLKHLEGVSAVNVAPDDDSIVKAE